MKVKVLVDSSIGSEFVDGYIRKNLINGYYQKYDNIEDDSVNLIFDGNVITVKRTDNIIEYLSNNAF